MKPFNSIKSIAIIYCLLFIQNAYSQKFVGLRVGVLFSNMKIDYGFYDVPTDFNNIISPQFVIPIEFSLGNHLAIQPELMYGQHGFTSHKSYTFIFRGSIYTSKVEENFRSHSIEIPLLGKITFGKNKLKFSVFAGPAFGLGIAGRIKSVHHFPVFDSNGKFIHEEKLSEESKVKYVCSGINSDEFPEDETPFIRTNFNLNLGAGLGYTLRDKLFFIDLRYILGLNDLIPDKKDFDYNMTGTSKRIGIGLGVMIPLGASKK